MFQVTGIFINKKPAIKNTAKEDLSESERIRKNLLAEGALEIAPEDDIVQSKQNQYAQNKVGALAGTNLLANKAGALLCCFIAVFDYNRAPSATGPGRRMLSIPPHR